MKVPAGLDSAPRRSPAPFFAQIWQAAEKVVYSRTLDAVSTGRTRIEREFEPSAVRRLKESAAGDLLIGGAELAAAGFAAGLRTTV